MVRLVALAALMTAPAVAGWERHVNGGGSDAPPPHPLAYFRVHPCLRSDPNDRVLPCFADNKPPSEAFKLDRTELVAVGTFGKFKAFELNYLFDYELHDKGTLDMKSILIQTGSDEFHEIYVVYGYPPPGGIGATAIVHVGQDQILCSGFWDGGAYSERAQVCFGSFDRSEPMFLDFTPVHEAARKAVPAGEGEIWDFASNFDFPLLTWRGGVNVGSGVAFCCHGTVTVTFRFDATGRVIPTEAKYEKTFDPDKIFR
jgi:hypothetical protein